jgi:hypothetical protein
MKEVLSMSKVNSMMSRVERFQEVIAKAKVVAIKALEEDKEKKSFRYLVTVDISDLKGWIWRFDPILLERYPYEMKFMDIVVEYVSRYKAARYAGYYGWIAYPADIKIGSGDEEETLTGFHELANRNMGCLGEKMGDKVPMSDEIKAILHRRDDTMYVRSCHDQIVKIYTQPELSEELQMTVEQYPNWVFQKVSPYKELSCHEYFVKGCESQSTCKAFHSLTYYPRVHVPIPGDVKPLEEAGTGQTRLLMGAVAALIGKMKDPTYPDLQGIYAQRGMAPDFHYADESQFPSCATCTMCKRIGRGIPGVDDNAEMGQSSIAQQKTDGIDPTWWCRAEEKWLEPIYEAMSDMNMQSIPASGNLGQSIINKAARESVCSRYSWFVRYSGNPNPTQMRRQHGAWHPWVPAGKYVDFVDSEENPMIVSKMPQIELSMILPEAHAERQRKFRIAIQG